jgi:hypothetical protein
MAMRWRIDINADWRASGKSYSSTPIMYCIAPGQSQTDWQTEKVKAVSDLQKLFDAINKANGLTFLMEMHSVTMAFPKGRVIDRMLVTIKDWTPLSGNGVVMTQVCKDLDVTQVMPLTQHLVDLAKAKHITLDMDVGKTQAVTLSTKQQFSPP